MTAVHGRNDIPQKCDSVRAQGQYVNEPNGGSMARRRFQRGMLCLRGKKKVWILKWRDDVIVGGNIQRVHRTEVIGTLSEFPTMKLARREADTRLAVVNNPRYRARPQATFAEFAVRWSDAILVNHKPSTQATIRSHIRKYLVPHFGRQAMKDVEPEAVQQFLVSLRVSPKTVRNIFVTLQIMWKSARAWKYVSHDVTEGVVLPQRSNSARRHFTVEEMGRILDHADEPYRTFYWLAIETGMRAGELCALSVDDVDFERGRIRIRRSVWRGKFGEPKTDNAVRSFAVSASLLDRLRSLAAERIQLNELLFRTRNGTPWDANLVVKRKLRPLLRSLEIPEAGLHSFRHSNASMMDALRVPMKVRQQRLGHSDIKLTMNVYTHVASEDDEKTAEQIADVLWSSVAKSKEKGLPENQEALVVQ